MKTIIDVINRCEPYICLIILIYILLSMAYDLYLLEKTHNFRIQASRIEEKLEEISKSRIETLIQLNAQNQLYLKEIQTNHNLNHQFR